MIRKTEYRLVGWTLAFGAAAAAVVAANPSHRNQPDAGAFVLKAAAESGRIRLDWDGSHSKVKAAEAGTLEVQDGGRFERYPLDRKVLLGGGLDYLRKSPDVFLTITLYRSGRPDGQTTVRTLASPQSPSFEAATRARAVSNSGRPRKAENQRGTKSGKTQTRWRKR